MVNNHRHSYGESIKNPPRALLLNSIQTTNYALNVRFRSIGPQTPTTVSTSSCKVEFRHGNMTLENPSPELLTVLIRELTGRGR